MGESLIYNTNLKELHLGGNPIKLTGAIKLMKHIENSPDTGIELLELSQIWINKCEPQLIAIENNEIKKGNQLIFVIKRK